MKRNWFNHGTSFKIAVLVLSFGFVFLRQRVWATSEMDIDADLLSASSITPTPTIQPTATLTAVILIPTVVLTPADKTEENPVESTPVPGQGILKMQAVYKAGLSYYQKQDFAKAIRYLKKSLDIHDPYTPKFYYAEANAMLGVIYQFHIIDRSLAYYYYRAALDIDPTTATAKKHIGEVSDEATK